MLQPKRTKYRKQHKGRIKGVAQRGSTIAFGSFGLKSLDSGRLTNRQIEAARIAMTRFMKREGKVWIRIFPDKPITSKPQEVRMGKGKGAVDHYIARVKSGNLIFEFNASNWDEVQKVTSQCSAKIGRRCKAVIREVGGVFSGGDIYEN